MSSYLKVAIMQPYFLPYIGYWQLINNVDIFVVYDDIEYSKKGWINRNRYLLNGKPETFTLPLKKDSDFLDVCQRRLSDSFSIEKARLTRRLGAAYGNAPYFKEGRALLADVLASREENLFQFVYQSIKYIHTRLGMASQLVVSSTLGIPRHLKGQDRVIATCRALNATEYINPIGGIELYNRTAFMDAEICLKFQKVKNYRYRQFNQEFVPHLSIIDPLMFLGIEGAKLLLTEMEIC